MKDQVYSWRVSAQTKAELESEARREGTSLAELLEQVTTDWLHQRRKSRNGDEAEQVELRRRVLATIGTIRGGDPTRAGRAAVLVRELVRKRHNKESHASRRSD